jgi:predicted O-methyltransferase YrrM
MDPPAHALPNAPIAGQLNALERELLANAILGAPRPPRVALEVGTWLGGGSTLHILRALERNGEGKLWGIEADRSIYERMLANLKAGAPETLHRFTPLFGFSQEVIPQWIGEQPPGFQVDFAFLDGGNNPLEQITEFRLLDPHMPVGAQLMAHDVKLRKGKWFAPYLRALDNWRTQFHDVSDEGLLHAQKIAPQPSPASLGQARRGLLKARLQPAEVAAALLPSALCGAILRLLPRRLSVRLSDGRQLERPETQPRR